ncbi:hypothetical protein K6120_03840 [Neisseria flava]|uniref:hypothetical protein n=1 Tax=Neisseria sicca TaxID=490 RepID=UPI001ADD61FA|nr:hypothetical protein [Neisseria sicca]MBY6283275.1 hypothetical protein [Neisseria flava]QTM24132.1 hypothetical protein J7445_05395 [Neisseria sicca]
MEKQQKKLPETSDDLCFEIFNPPNRYKGGRAIPLGKMTGLFLGIWILKEDYYSLFPRVFPSFSFLKTTAV